MQNKLPHLTARQVARFLGMELDGPDLVILGAYSLNNCQPGGMIFCENSSPAVLEKISCLTDCMVICREDLAVCLTGTRVVSPNPRLSFILVLERYFTPPRSAGIHPSAVIDAAARIGNRGSVGAFCWIGPEVVIGDDCMLHQHVVIDGATTIGNRCEIKSNTVIGEAGFSFCLDEQGIPHHFPHLGKIHIGNDVWIGANSTIERAVLEDTVLEDHVKLDDHVQIGHNTHIGRGSQIAAGAIICAKARVGAECWIGPNANVIGKRLVGKKSLVGLGANVITDVPENSVFVGNPARRLRDNNP